MTSTQAGRTGRPGNKGLARRPESDASVASNGAEVDATDAISECAHEAGNAAKANAPAGGDLGSPLSGNSSSFAGERRPWTEEEDTELERAVRETGASSWLLVAAKLNSKSSTPRTSKQCRVRWTNHLDPSLNKGAWTNEEWLILVDAQRSLGNRWTEIAKLLPGRTDGMVKNQWYSRKRREMRVVKRNKLSAASPTSVSPRPPPVKSPSRKRKAQGAPAGDGDAFRKSVTRGLRRWRRDPACEDGAPVYAPQVLPSPLPVHIATIDSRPQPGVEPCKAALPAQRRFKQGQQSHHREDKLSPQPQQQPQQQQEPQRRRRRQRQMLQDNEHDMQRQPPKPMRRQPLPRKANAPPALAAKRPLPVRIPSGPSGLPADTAPIMALFEPGTLQLPEEWSWRELSSSQSALRPTQRAVSECAFQKRNLEALRAEHKKVCLQSLKHSDGALVRAGGPGGSLPGSPGRRDGDDLLLSHFLEEPQPDAFLEADLYRPCVSLSPAPDDYALDEALLMVAD